MPRDSTSSWLYVSARTRRLYFFLALALLAVGAALSIAAPRPFDAFGENALGGGVVLLTIVYACRLPELHCAFCGARRADVDLLVAAPAVAICDRCAAYPLGIVAEELERRGTSAKWHARLLEALPRRCPWAMSGPILRACAEASADAPQLRALYVQASRLSHHEASRDLLQRIPEAERSASDWLNLGVTRGALGQHTEALRDTRRAAALADSGLRPWCLNNAAYFSLRSIPEATPDERRRWLADVEDARRLLASESTAEKVSVLSRCYGTEAEIKRTLGDITGAQQAIAEAERLTALSCEALLIRARVLAAAGKGSEARVEAERALAAAHPETYAAREARELLVSLG